MVLNISLLEIAFFGDLNVLLSGTHIILYIGVFIFVHPLL